MTTVLLYLKRLVIPSDQSVNEVIRWHRTDLWDRGSGRGWPVRAATSIGVLSASAPASSLAPCSWTLSIPHALINYLSHACPGSGTGFYPSRALDSRREDPVPVTGESEAGYPVTFVLPSTQPGGRRPAWSQVEASS